MRKPPDSFSPELVTFKSILEKTTMSLIPDLKQELTMLPDDLLIEFRNFPRNNQEYRSIIKILTNTSKIHTQGVLLFLKELFVNTIQSKTNKMLPIMHYIVSEYDPNDNLHVYFIRYFQFILITDLITSIVASNPLSPDYKYLLDLGYMLCSISLNQPIFYEIILPQFAYIVHNISKFQFNQFYDSFSQLIINKPEPYFILVKYVHLDPRNTNSFDFMDIIFDYMNHQYRRKTLTNVMLEAASTLLLKFVANDQLITKFTKLANNVKDHPVLKYGSLELIAALKSNNRISFEERLKFYQDVVVPFIKDEASFIVVVRVFYILAFGIYINSNQFLSFWAPESSEFEFIPIKMTETTKNEIIKWSEQFMLTIFPHPYFVPVQSIIRNTLLYFACANFDSFLHNIAEKFMDLADDRFTTFLLCVAPINTNVIHADKNLVETFNNKLSSITYTKLSSYPHDHMGFRFFSNKIFDKGQSEEKSKNIIDEIMDKWDVNPGKESQVMIRSESFQINENIYLPSPHLIETLPYILYSNSVKPTMWISMLVKLSAINNSAIARPASIILLHYLEDQKEKMKTCDNLIEMINIKQAPEIVFVCINLLLNSAKCSEPSLDESEKLIYRKMEFVSFLCLASEYQFLRSAAFQLLVVVNKLQRNEGFYSYIEKHIQTIESNVKHNILIQQLPKRPENHKFYVEEISIETALTSPYQAIWNYFLSEIAKTTAFIQYSPIIDGIIRISKQFLDSHRNHLTQGLLVIFFSMSIIKSNLNKQFYINESFPSIDSLVSIDMNILQEIIEKLFTKESFPHISALKYANYTLVPFVLNIMRSVTAKETSIIIALTLDVLYNLLKTIEGMNNIRTAIYEDLHIILDTAEIFLPIRVDYKITNPQHLVLYYYLCKQFWILSNKQTIAINAKMSSLRSILKLYNYYKHDHKFICYAASTLAVLLETKSSFGTYHENTIKDLLKVLIVCEEHNYEVLSPLLSADFKLFIPYYIDNCYTESPSTSDFFFSAIYYVFENAQKEGIKKITSHPHSLLTIGLYKLKTGSSLAGDFLEGYLELYASEKMVSVVQQLKQDISSRVPIIDIILKYMSRHSEAIVHTALTVLKNHPHSVSVKVMADIISPFVSQFRLLPYQTCCLAVTSHAVKMSPYNFLNLLFEVTCSVKSQDFEHLAEIWSTLLMNEDSLNIVLPFLFEMKNAEIQGSLFDELVLTHRKDVLSAVVTRLKFSFYAYCAYQGDRRYEEEMWIVPVITHCVQCPEVSNSPIVVNYALLFHPTHTMTLLKKLCKHFKIPYSRRTLSDSSLAFTVQKFVESFKARENGAKLIEEWALEAMRWVIGCKSIKIASASLVILNQIDFVPDNTTLTAFFRGIFRSVAYFLSNSTELDQFTSKYINDTFAYFSKFFDGNESLAFSYIHCFFEFVVIVDAYFDKMIPLFAKCRKSPVTKDISENYLLLAIRPVFNELESDNKAKQIFNQLIDEHEDLIDFRLVRSLLKTPDEFAVDIRDIELDIETKDFNRLLGHLSFMSLTASSDLMRRIFIAARMILRKYAKARGRLNFSRTSRKLGFMQSSSLTDLLHQTSERRTSSSDEIMNLDIDKRDIHILYKAALSRVMSMQESIDLILSISSIEPLVATENFVEFRDFVAEAKVVVQSLNQIDDGTNVVVSFTECQDLESTSHLLNPESRPKIQPFTSQHEIVELISKETVDTSPASPTKKFYQWVMEMKAVCSQLRENIKAKLPSDTPFIEKEFKLLVPPKEVKPDLDFSPIVQKFDPLLPKNVLFSTNKRNLLSRQTSVKIEW